MRLEEKILYIDSLKITIVPISVLNETILNIYVDYNKGNSSTTIYYSLTDKMWHLVKSVLTTRQKSILEKKIKTLYKEFFI